MMKRYLEKIITALILLFSVTLLYSISLDAYRNQAEFEYKYSEMSYKVGSQKYWDLRDSYLTPKYNIQEMSLNLIVFLIVSIFIVKNEGIKSPPSKKLLFFYGVLASFIFTVYYVTSLILDQQRGCFPHWADSLGIPLFFTPLYFTFFIIVFTISTLLKYKTYAPSYNLKKLEIVDFKSYFGIISILNIIFLISSLLSSWVAEPSQGFIFTIFLFVSLYFNLSLIKGSK